MWQGDSCEAGGIHRRGQLCWLSGAAEGATAQRECVYILGRRGRGEGGRCRSSSSGRARGRRRAARKGRGAFGQRGGGGGKGGGGASTGFSCVLPGVCVSTAFTCLPSPPPLQPYTIIHLSTNSLVLDTAMSERTGRHLDRLARCHRTPGHAVLREWRTMSGTCLGGRRTLHA